MSRIDQSCSTPDVASQFEDGVSEPEPASPPKAPEVAPEPEHPCAQQSTDVYTPYEPGQSVAPETPRIDNPRKFDYPLAPELELKLQPGETHAEGKARGEALTGKYVQEYREYVADFRKAMQRCTSPEQLRALEPKYPDTGAVALFRPEEAQELADLWGGFAKEKTRLMDKLSGREAPGSFSAGLDVEVGVGVEGFEYAVKGTVDADSRGTRSDVKGALKAGTTVFVGVDDRGKGFGGVKVGSQSVKVTQGGSASFTTKTGPLEGTVSYSPKDAKVAVGVAVAGEGDLGGGVKVKVKAGAHVALKGLTQEDAKRTLEGADRPTGDDVAARFLYEQQLRAQLKR